jgi:hypothetical protein
MASPRCREKNTSGQIFFFKYERPIARVVKKAAWSACGIKKQQKSKFNLASLQKGILSREGALRAETKMTARAVDYKEGNPVYSLLIVSLDWLRQVVLHFNQRCIRFQNEEERNGTIPYLYHILVLGWTKEWNQLVPGMGIFLSDAIRACSTKSAEREERLTNQKK